MPVTQLHFRKALLDPDVPSPDGLSDGAGQPAHKRFDVYRNNVTVALIDALRSAFPVLCKLLGGQNFDQLARVFVRTHPPSSPLMMHYGAEMPGFLTDFAPLQHIGYLSDVARLELALRRSYHAADTAPFDAARLGVITPEALMASTLILASAVELVPSVWPLVDIWRFNTEDGAEKPKPIGQSALITRAEFDPIPHALSPDQAAWVLAVIKGATLSQAQDAACTKNEHFDLTSVLTILIQNNTISDLTTPKELRP